METRRIRHFSEAFDPAMLKRMPRFLRGFLEGELNMLNCAKRIALPHPIVVAGLFAGLVLVTGSALAGECPPDQVGVDVREPGPSEPAGVTDTVLAATDLGQEMLKAEGRSFRLRQLVIEPGGIVPWHSHADRPAIIYIVSGTVEEYSSTCAVPIVHTAGDVARETHTTSHWWKNTGGETAVLLSADILHTDDEHMM
jgi:quercetin dioxygenase-like cupin family protein